MSEEEVGERSEEGTRQEILHGRLFEIASDGCAPITNKPGARPWQVALLLFSDGQTLSQSLTMARVGLRSIMLRNAEISMHAYASRRISSDRRLSTIISTDAVIATSHRPQARPGSI